MTVSNIFAQRYEKANVIRLFQWPYSKDYSSQRQWELDMKPPEMPVWWIDCSYGPNLQWFPVPTLHPVSIPPPWSGCGHVPCFGQWDNNNHDISGDLKSTSALGLFSCCSWNLLLCEPAQPGMLGDGMLYYPTVWNSRLYSFSGMKRLADLETTATEKTDRYTQIPRGQSRPCHEGVG